MNWVWIVAIAATIWEKSCDVVWMIWTSHARDVSLESQGRYPPPRYWTSYISWEVPWSAYDGAVCRHGEGVQLAICSWDAIWRDYWGWVCHGGVDTPNQIPYLSNSRLVMSRTSPKHASWFSITILNILVQIATHWLKENGLSRFSPMIRKR